MCCYQDKATEREVMARFGTRKTVVFWKALLPDGYACPSGERYTPGVNKARCILLWYRTGCSYGLHVYMDKPKFCFLRGMLLVPVICHRNDFVRAGENQALFRKLTIRKKAWAEAGFKP